MSCLLISDHTVCMQSEASVKALDFLVSLSTVYVSHCDWQVWVGMQVLTATRKANHGGKGWSCNGGQTQGDTDSVCPGTHQDAFQKWDESWRKGEFVSLSWGPDFKFPLGICGPSFVCQDAYLARTSNELCYTFGSHWLRNHWGFFFHSKRKMSNRQAIMTLLPIKHRKLLSWPHHEFWNVLVTRMPSLL